MYFKKKQIMIKKRSTINVTVITLLLLVVVSLSCAAANRTDLVKCGVVTIEQKRTGKAYIAWSSAYKEKDGLVITGVLRRRDHVGRPINTHVDVTIVSPDGIVLDEARSSGICVSRRITGRGYLSFERFKIRIPSVPAQGSLVRLVSHSGKHDDATKS
jgi:hypothetical protein